MLFQKLALLSAIAAIAGAQDVDNNDIPPQCRAVCASLIATAQQCDSQTNDDAAELSCVCNSANAGTVIPTCEACVAQFDRDDDPNDVSDVREILNRCNLSTTTYNSASASQLLSSMTNGPPAPSGGPVVTTTSGTVVVTMRPTPTPPTNGPTGPNGSNGPAGASNAPPQATGAAPAQTAAVRAAIGLGAFGVAVGLL